MAVSKHPARNHSDGHVAGRGFTKALTETTRQRSLSGSGLRRGSFADFIEGLKLCERFAFIVNEMRAAARRTPRTISACRQRSARVKPWPSGAAERFALHTDNGNTQLNEIRG